MIGLIAAANYNKAYQIRSGQEMELVELRPSYTQRFKDSYNLYQASEAQRQEILNEQLKMEEEKDEVR